MVQFGTAIRLKKTKPGHSLQRDDGTTALLFAPCISPALSLH